MLQSELATITPEPIMKDTTWSTVRVSPLVAVARGMLRLRIRTTPRSVFSSFAQFSQLAVSEIVKELSSPRAKRAGPKGPRAESARAVTGRRNSYRWEGGRLFEPSAGFFYGNSCNSGTESRKIVPKVGN